MQGKLKDCDRPKCDAVSFSERGFHVVFFHLGCVNHSNLTPPSLAIAPTQEVRGDLGPVTEALFMVLQELRVQRDMLCDDVTVAHLNDLFLAVRCP